MHEENAAMRRQSRGGPVLHTFDIIWELCIWVKTPRLIPLIDKRECTHPRHVPAVAQLLNCSFSALHYIQP